MCLHTFLRVSICKELNYLVNYAVLLFVVIDRKEVKQETKASDVNTPIKSETDVDATTKKHDVIIHRPTPTTIPFTPYSSLHVFTSAYSTPYGRAHLPFMHPSPNHLQVSPGLPPLHHHTDSRMMQRISPPMTPFAPAVSPSPSPLPPPPQIKGSDMIIGQPNSPYLRHSSISPITTVPSTSPPIGHPPIWPTPVNYFPTICVKIYTCYASL